MDKEQEQELDTLRDLFSHEGWKIMTKMGNVQTEAIRNKCVDTAKTEYELGYCKGRKDGVAFFLDYPENLELMAKELEKQETDSEEDVD